MLNAAIRDIPLPKRLGRRPINERGFPVPWFVSRINGVWDFVNLDPNKVFEAARQDICFLCGEKLGQYKAFVIGPMCSINRISAEPPAHFECAEYAVKACPFLARPNAKRNYDKVLIGCTDDIPGMAILHNPGVTLIWVTKGWQLKGGLFHLGEPVTVHWYAEGRTATRTEIDAAIAKGLPLLRQAAASEGRQAMRELDRYIERAERLLP